MADIDRTERQMPSSWLERAESDLAGRVERHIGTLGSDWHPNEPVYQRLSSALERVRREL